MRETFLKSENQKRNFCIKRSNNKHAEESLYL